MALFIYTTVDGKAYAAGDGATLIISNPMALVTDRTQSDVNRALYLQSLTWEQMTDAEKAEWSVSLKGTYNAEDFNRVGEAIEFLKNRFAEHDIRVWVSPRTDWTIDERPTPKTAGEYLRDVSVIRNILRAKDTTPAVPSDMDNFTFSEANDIEQILLDVDALISQIKLAWIYSGEFEAGGI